MSTNQAIIRKSVTVAVTFTGKPGEEVRKRMKAAGAEFKNGQWVRNISDGATGNEEDAVRMFEGAPLKQKA